MTVRPLGATGLTVTALCVGTSPLANMPQLYGYEVSEERAVATIEAVLDNPAVNFLDTSNGYGEDGSAERRVGTALRGRGGLPAGVVLATKVDPDPRTGEFSGRRVRASLEESLQRLGLDRIQLLHLHDPERISFAEATAADGPVEALADLKRQGLVAHLGVAGGPVALMQQYLDTGVFEVVLTHNRYTLLDRSAEPLFRAAHDSGIGVLNAAPYGGGMLAKGPAAQTKYAYGEREDAIAAAAAAMAAAAARFGIPLAAAALQFSLRAPFIGSTVVGVSSPERVQQTLDLAGTPIPDELWAELETLVPAPDRWLDPPSY
ncbi:aldo/keto reductase [Paractinoplanes hotanensis]|uniref:Aldo/keto reductase n=1 Tax=Paractinoplanes hotanensis TaxID=2906497 RepID=A0ABT0XY67_9ACTN|nr:aldo/keto reductase [Actinoplanes hotanensis]MCM4078152.1 aldo/keto reductase [Actinoplanes hotanensis]